jgi:hypothetical protein
MHPSTPPLAWCIATSLQCSLLASQIQRKRHPGSNEQLLIEGVDQAVRSHLRLPCPLHINVAIFSPLAVKVMLNLILNPAMK